MEKSSQGTLRLGIIVPSSNTALEPLTQEIVSDIPTSGAAITLHFARFRVTEIDLTPESHSQFDNERMLEAAKLLAEAHVDMIGWCGTSAAWLGFQSDRELCAEIQSHTGVPAAASMLAMRDLLAREDVPDGCIGLVTPYLPDVNDAICQTFGKEGFEISQARSRCYGLSTNFDFAQVSEAALDEMVATVVANGAKRVLVVCTNLVAAQRAKHWEELYQISVFDSAATVIRGMLQSLGVDSKALCERWGTVFDS